jgi:solute carrier family 35 (UDP-sugar transporter), member A1/2/3
VQQLQLPPRPTMRTTTMVTTTILFYDISRLHDQQVDDPFNRSWCMPVSVKTTNALHTFTITYTHHFLFLFSHSYWWLYIYVHFFKIHVLIIIVGPTALIGGTAAFYSAVYRHSACTLSPLSAFYLLLLALQTSIQPRLSRKFIKSTSNQQAVALTEEVVKTIFAAGLFFTCQDYASIIQPALHNWSVSSSLAVAGIPSILYAAQGVLTYTSHQHLNAVTFNGLSQTKTVSAALFCYLLLGTRQSPIQMLAIGILFVSALIFQGLIFIRPHSSLEQSSSSSSSSSSSPPAKGDTAASSSHPPPTNATSATISNESSSSSSSSSSSRDSTWFAKGIVPCLGATFLSGLAGAFSQRGLQTVGGTGRNAFLFTIEISFYSALTLIMSMFWNNNRHHFHSRIINKNDSMKNTKTAAETTPFSWNKIWQHRHDMYLALIPITVKAMGGILTALVHKHAGSVLKGFALVLGLVLSGLLQTAVDRESLTVNQGIGTLLVMLSSWMHFTNPPQTPTV